MVCVITKHFNLKRFGTSIVKNRNSNPNQQNNPER